MRLRYLMLASLLAVMPAGGANAETKGAAPKQAEQPTLPVSLEQALYLIRSTLLTLNDANRTGNYTVLRDLAAPGFRANTAADLGVIFSDLRKRNVDLFAVALLGPQLTTAPAIDANKMLRLTGFFPTRPLQIVFDLIFQTVDGQWMLYGLSVATPQAPEDKTAPPPAEDPPAPAAKPKPKPLKKTPTPPP